MAEAVLRSEEALASLNEEMERKNREYNEASVSQDEQIRQIDERWEKNDAEQQEAAKNPDDFAARTVLESKKIQGIEPNISPEELSKLTKAERSTRMVRAVEKYEEDMEKLEMDWIDKTT